MHLIKLIKFFALIFFLSPLGLQAASDRAEPTAQQAITELQQWRSLIEEYRAQIDPLSYSEDGALEELDYDANDIIAFVTQKVRYEPYAGVLRGSLGTLRAQAGNTIDQSVLLAKLLKDAGLDARIAYAELTEKQALNLLDSVFSDSWLRREGDGDRFDDVLGKMSKKVRESKQWAKPLSVQDEEIQFAISDAKSRADRHAKYLLKSLGEEGVNLLDRSIPKEIVSEARQYYWVQYRESSQKPWQNAHPADSSQYFAALEAQDYYFDTVPKELTQEFEIQARIRIQTNGKEVVHALMAPWRQAVSNIQTNGVTFSLGSLDVGKWIEGSIDDWDVTFVPSIDGQYAAGAMAFDLRGNLAPADIALSPQSPLFKTIGNKFASALDGLGSADTKPVDKNPVRGVEEVWLDIQLHQPIGSTKSWKRTLYERSNVIDEQSHASRVAREVHFSIQTGRDNSDALKHAALSNASSAIQSVIKPPNEGAYKIVPGTLLTSLIQLHDGTKGVVSFRNQPLVVAYHKSLFGESPQGFDIINNSRRSLGKNNSGIHLVPKVSMRFGVWETVSETVAAAAISGNTALSTVSELDRFVDIDDARLAVSKISDGRYAGQLKAAAPAELTSKAWWRVDPTSGEALGITARGWGGSELSEYMTLQQLSRSLACISSVMTGCSTTTAFAVAAINIAALYYLPADVNIKLLLPNFLATYAPAKAAYLTCVNAGVVVCK